MTVHYNERDICDIWALMIGSPGTPYAYGFYQVSFYLPSLRDIFLTFAAVCNQNSSR